MNSRAVIIGCLLFFLACGESSSPPPIEEPEPPIESKWEPSLISECKIDENISPILSSAAEVLPDNNYRMIEPAVLYIDQTFTYLMRSDAGTTTITNPQLDEAGFMVVNDTNPSIMYDDGTHGDLIANDGVYTRACMYLPEEHLNSAPFVGRLDIWFIKPEYRGTEEVESISEGVAFNEVGFFIEVGDEYNYRAKNSWRLHSPETCGACETAWSISGDVFDFFIVSTRDAFNGDGYVRVHDNIKGTGFNPPCEPRSYCYNIIDGEEHQKLTGIIWSGWTGIEAMNHELGHGLLGMNANNFPAEGIRAWNSGDGAHIDSDTTVTGELSGPFWDPDRGWPYPVVFETSPGVYEETYLTRDQQGDFRLTVIDDANRVWADIFLYMMGLVDADDVTETYYKLVNPALEGCITNEYNLLCTNNLVTAEESIPFNINDFISQFGERVMPENFDPTLIKLGVLHISDRPHTDAEIVWFTNSFKEFISTDNSAQTWIYGTSWHKATRGLSRVEIYTDRIR